MGSSFLTAQVTSPRCNPPPATAIVWGHRHEHCIMHPALSLYGSAGSLQQHPIAGASEAPQPLALRPRCIMHLPHGCPAATACCQTWIPCNRTSAPQPLAHRASLPEGDALQQTSTPYFRPLFLPPFFFLLFFFLFFFLRGAFCSSALAQPPRASPGACPSPSWLGATSNAACCGSAARAGSSPACASLPAGVPASSSVSHEAVSMRPAATGN
jgi:hypothetical protein